MPSKAKRPCGKAGCSQLAENQYCEAHAHLNRHRLYDTYSRNKRLAVFYHSQEWQRAREQALIRDHYLCQDCLIQKRITKAEVVDHIKPVRFFWQLRLVLDNLRSLCQACHNRKTAEDKRRYARK